MPEPEAPSPPRRRREDFKIQYHLDDVRGLLAIIALVGAFALAFAQLFLKDGTSDIPTWAASTVSAILGFYFGGRERHDRNGNPPRR
jgi:hypothetical protein